MLTFGWFCWRQRLLVYSEDRTMRGPLTLSALFLGLATTVAAACPGQTGKVIFNDNFSDDSGGWDSVANTAFVPNALQLTANANTVGVAVHNLTFNATDGDYCAEFVFPSSPPDAKNKDSVGLEVAASDYNNFFLFLADTSGVVRTYRKMNGAWSQIGADTKVDAIKTDPGSVNSLRVVVKDQKMTFFVNGTQVKVLRGQVAANQTGFGVFVESENAPSNPRVFLLKSFNLTDGSQ
jgi:hypothetical protein